jgi:hypothetical protein
MAITKLSLAKEKQVSLFLKMAALELVLGQVDMALRDAPLVNKSSTLHHPSGEDVLSNRVIIVFSAGASKPFTEQIQDLQRANALVGVDHHQHAQLLMQLLILQWDNSPLYLVEVKELVTSAAQLQLQAQRNVLELVLLLTPHHRKTGTILRHRFINFLVELIFAAG